VRADRGTELGSVEPEYTPLQNRDAFQPIRPLVDEGILKLETGGVLRKGADAWLLGRFDVERFGPIVQEVFADEIVPYILVANNHNGRRKARIAETPIRVVCANTLDMADHDLARGRGRSVGVRHVPGASRRMIEAVEELLGAVIERYEALARQYRVLKSVRLTPTEFDTLVLDPVAPDPRTKPGWTASTPSAEAALERALHRRFEILRLWTEGDGHIGDLSAWEAYNALVQAVDHGTTLFPVRLERTRSLLDGRLRDVKRSCKHRLLDHAMIANAGT
jgi:phage/plasmid-like protein (TIGR03299 family)